MSNTNDGESIGLALGEGRNAMELQPEFQNALTRIVELAEAGKLKVDAVDHAKADWDELQPIGAALVADLR